MVVIPLLVLLFQPCQWLARVSDAPFLLGRVGLYIAPISPYLSDFGVYGQLPFSPPHQDYHLVCANDSIALSRA